MAVLGIDISKWNGKWDAGKAKAAGAVFVFIKSSQATFTDLQFNVNWQKAKDAGLLRGAYHYLDYTKPGRDQANYFADLLAADAGELPPVVDFEQTRPDNNYVAARASLRDCLEQLKSRGRNPFIYTAPSFWAQYGDTTPYWGQFPLWLAHYTTAITPTVPAPWSRWLFWQYTSKGNGVTFGTESLNVDMNRFNGTPDDLNALAGIQKPATDLENRVAMLEQRMTTLEQIVATLQPSPPTPTPTPTPPPPSDELYAVCIASNLNVRSGPGVSYPVVGGLVYGQRVAVLERQDGWAQIAAPAGWCNEKYLQYE